MRRGTRYAAAAVAALALALPAGAASAAPQNQPDTRPHTSSTTVQDRPGAPWASGQSKPGTPETAATQDGASRAAFAGGLPSYEQWITDVTRVTETAKQYLDSRLPDPTIRPAIVLDIDNTSLDTGYCQWLVFCSAIPPVLHLAKQAESAGAAVFFVTARPEIIRPLTEYNLREEGFTIHGLYMRGWLDFEANHVMKTKARTNIENRGYRIVANIGNSATDLDGGHAERTFKLPDYNGQLS